MRLGCYIAVVLFFVHGGPAFSALTFDQIKMLYERKVGEIEAARGEELAKLGQRYRDSLEMLLDKHSKSGDLDRALAVKEEISRVKDGAISELPELEGERTPRLSNERRKFEKARVDLNTRAQREKEAAEEKYLELLDDLVMTLTREKKLEAAVEVRDELESIQNARRAAMEADDSISSEELEELLVGTQWTYLKDTKGKPYRTKIAFTTKKTVMFSPTYRVRWEAFEGRKITLNRADWVGEATIVFDEAVSSFKGFAADGDQLSGKRLAPPPDAKK